MQYKNTLEAVYIQLNELQQNIAGWGADKHLRNIDIDLTLAKLRDVYDLVLMLKAEPDFIPEPLETSKTPPIISSKRTMPIAEPKLDEVPEVKEEPKIETKELSKEKIIEELKKKVIDSTLSNEKTNLSEKFESNRPTLNEELSMQVESSDLANHLKNRPITNLASAIGLNEKFEFINSLFNGDKEQYEETIEKLNMATNFNEAYNYLSTTLNMNMSEPSTQRILDLIRRKLIAKNNG